MAHTIRRESQQNGSNNHDVIVTMCMYHTTDYFLIVPNFTHTSASEYISILSHNMSRAGARSTEHYTVTLSANR